MKKIRIFNPMSEDITMTYDINGDKKPDEFKVFAMESAQLPEAVAHRMANKIAKQLYHKRGRKTNYQADVKNILSNEVYLEKKDYEARVY